MSLHVDGQNISIPNNNELGLVTISFSESNNVMTTHACNELSGDVVFEDNPDLMNFSNLLQTLIQCENSDNSIFEGYYFNFFYEDITEPFEYGIVIIDGPPDNYILVIESASGNWAEYWDYNLGIKDNFISDAIIFPNPVNDSFSLSIKNLDDVQLSLFDITGKKVFQQEYVSDKLIDISYLKTGIYFISIEDNLGNTSTKKLIKK